MAKQIRVSADNSEVKKSILDIKRSVNELSKSKIELMTPETKKFLRGEAVKQMNDLNQKVQKTKQSIDEQLKSLKKVTEGTKEELELKNRVLEKQKQLNKLVKEQASLQTVAKDLGMQGKLKDIGGSVGKIPGLGRFGSLMRMGLIGTGVAGLVGAGAFGVSRVAAGFGTFQRGAADRMALMGRGVRDLDLADPSRAAGAGLNSLSMRQARLQAMDVFGASGATQASVLQRAELERNFGLESGTFAGIGGSLRGNLGGREANKAVMNMQAALIATSISDEIGPYLQTAADMLVALNDRGFTFDDSALAALGAMIGQTGRIERSGRLLQGVDEAIRGSSGDANAFFQQVFGMAGIGGGTIGGAQAAIRSGGLFGLNLDRMGGGIGNVDRQAFEAIGLGQRSSQTIAASTLNMLDRMFGSEGQASEMMNSGNASTRQAGALNRLSRNRFVMRTFGLQNEAQAAEVNQILKTLADPKSSEKQREKARQELANIQEGNTELGNLKRINESTAGSLDVLRNLRQTTEDILGSRIAPSIETAQRALLRIDQMISKLMGAMGFSTPQEAMQSAISGDSAINKQTLDLMSPDERSKAIAKMQELNAADQAKVDYGRKRGLFTGDIEERMDLRTKNMTEMQGASMTPGQVEDAVNRAISGRNSSSGGEKLAPILKEILDPLKKTASSSERTARYSRGFGTLPATGSKTMGN